MFEELHDVERRHEELAHRMSAPDAAQDPAAYAALMREYKQLEPLVETYREYVRACGEMAELEEAGRQSGLDDEFKAMLQQEACENARNKTELEAKLKLLLLPRDADDDKSVILEIRAGAGGEEAALFAASLWRMYTMYAAKQGWRTEVISLSETELGGVKELILDVEGVGAFSKLKFESGVHRVQRVPETETQGRIHTSTVTVAVMPEAEEVELTIDPKDLRIDTFRASGAGGQHINKTSSAVRLIHKPTGIVTSCQTQRSQLQNREYAMEMLKAKLYQIALQQHKDKIDDIKGVQNEIAWGHQIRSYVFMPYTLVKDHRTNYENGNVQAVMDGDLDGFIYAYLKASSRGELQDV